MKNKSIGFGKSTIIYTLGDLISKGLNFALLPLYVGVLSESEYGRITFTLTITSILNVLFSLGFAGAVTRLYYDSKNENDQKTLLGTATLFIITFSICLSILFYFIGTTFFANNFLGLAFTPYGTFAIIISFLVVFGSIPQAIFKIQNKPVLYIAFNISVFLLTILFTFIFVVIMKKGSSGALIALLLANFFMAVAYFLFIIGKIKLIIDKTVLSALLILSIPLLPHLISHWILSLSDRLILSHYLGIESVGVYSIGYQIGSLIFLIANAINSAWVPFYYHTRTTGVGNDHLRMIVKNIVLVINTICILVVSFSPILLDILSIGENKNYMIIIGLVSLAGIFQMYYFIFVSQTFFSKEIKWIPMITISTSFVNIIINIIFIPHFGIIAAATSTIISYIILAISNGLLGYRKSKIDIGIKNMIIVSFLSVSIVMIFIVFVPFIYLYYAICLPLLWFLFILASRSYSIKELKSLIFFRGFNSG